MNFYCYHFCALSMHEFLMSLTMSLNGSLIMSLNESLIMSLNTLLTYMWRENNPDFKISKFTILDDYCTIVG